MKKYLYMAVAAIAALSSCSDDAVINGVNEPVLPTNPNVNAPVFTATIEGEGTRTQLVEGSTAGKLTKVAWVSADKVSINGSAYTVAPGTEDATTATLTIAEGETVPEAVDGKYYAVYPSSIAFNTTTKTLTLPATQTHDANGIGNVPMVAVSENTTLQFKNICAVLAITVTEGTVKKIKVMADGKALSGDFDLDFTLDPPVSDITATSGENYVVLDCGEGVTAENTTFYIAIPPQEYSSLQIYLSEDGTTYKEAMATKNTQSGTFVRNKIYPITYKANAVQLWADGPYFATENVGGTQKYQWGATAAGGTGNYTTVTGGAVTANTYDLDHDTAYKIWGSAWRMPTQAECAALLDNCNYSFDNSAFGLSSKTSGYGSISFPVEDGGNSYGAYYCTSTVHNNGWPYLLNFTVSSGGSQFANTSGTSSPADVSFVRAVLATPAAAPAVTPDPTPTPTSNLLAGEFSVSATKKVQFTKGNLYWDGSAYQFEANQTAYQTAWNTSHVGHFFWSSYADYTRTDEHAHEYKPYYSSLGASSKTTSDEFWCGEAHPLEVAGTQGLYVLSAEEWHYLTGMFTYASYSDVRNETNKFANAMVNGKKGLLIFPDGYNGTTPVSGITGIAEVNNDYTAYPTESIPTDTWSAMEAAGVVFLPAAGYRGDPNGQTISPDYCQYWSSTPYDNNSTKDYEYAYGLFGADYGEFQCPGKIKRNYGSSIRLVQTVGADPAPTPTPNTESLGNGGNIFSNN